MSKVSTQELDRELHVLNVRKSRKCGKMSRESACRPRLCERLGRKRRKVNTCNKHHNSHRKTHTFSYR